jgi:high-affinity iron transporter
VLPTFVIGLREGLEASLIVGIVAAFLKQRGRSDLLRWVLAGITAAIALCVAAGVALDIVSRDLPQRQQEGLETVVGAVAVAMVTYMVIWMRRNSRNLKGQLEGAAGAALAAGSGLALVAMAFLAVLREGLETVVFLLAAFNETHNSAAAGSGALLGILVAVGLGLAIYRGGVKLNLSKFFRATGVVLVLVAGGLVMTALHTAHEAGWLLSGQQSTVDLTSVVRPGSVQASLLTGVLGLQPKPVLIEVLGWLVYIVPVGLYVAWPPGRGPSRRTVVRTAIGSAALVAVAAVALAVAAPATPAARPVTTAGGVSAQVVSTSGAPAVIRTNARTVTGTGPAVGAPTDLTATRTGSESHSGAATDVYTATRSGTGQARATLSIDQVAALNGGRLPLGSLAASGRVPVTYPSTTTITIWLDPRSDRIMDVRWAQSVTVVATFDNGPATIGAPRSSSVQFPNADSAAAVVRAGHDASVVDRQRLFRGLAAGLGVLALVALAVAGMFLIQGGRSRPHELENVTVVSRDLVAR